MNTKLIALEGIDGSGKTYQEALLLERLKGSGYSVQTKAFPEYGGFFGKRIGELLRGDGLRADRIDSKSMCLWYALDRFSAFKGYSDGESDFLLINRYVASNAVYQSIREIDIEGEKSPDNWEWVKELEHVQLGLPQPDLYLIFDIDPQRAQQNVDKKGARDYIDGRDVYESQEGLLRRARERYLKLAARETNFEIIPCMTPSGDMLAPQEICDKAWRALAERGLIQ